MTTAIDIAGLTDSFLPPAPDLPVPVFLVLRPEDHLVMGLAWEGLRLDPGAVGSTPTLVADGDPAALVFILPPQATAEASYDPGAATPPAARVGGSSAVWVPVAAGTRVELTADALLAALRDAANPAFDIDLPWGVHTAPEGAAGVAARVATQVAAATTAAGDTGLWRARITAPGGLALRPLQPMRPIDDAGGAVPALGIGDRTRIAAEADSTGILPTAPDVELSALGGSVSVEATWPTFAWQHDVRLGRDMLVRVESKGVLYPFGHRAVLTQFVERSLDPPDGQSVTAGLTSTAVLLIGEPVRRPADDGPAAAREFPFGQVDIVGAAFPLHSRDLRDVPTTYPRIPKRLDQVIADRDALIAARDAQDTAVTDLLAQLRQDVLATAATDSDSRSASLGEIVAKIADLRAAEAAWQEAASHIPTGTGPPEDLKMEEELGAGESATQEPTPPAVDLPPRPDLSVIPGLENDVAALSAEIRAIEEQRDRSLAALQDENGLTAFGGGDVLAEAQRLREAAANESAHVATLIAEAANPIEAIEWPLAPDGTRLQLPVRCDGLAFRVPVLFVHDIDLADTDDFPAFASLRSDEVALDLASAWAGSTAARVPIPAVPLDLIRSDRPQDGDVHEVHEIVLAAEPDRGTFRPRLASAVVDLPALRNLLPELPSRVAVSFDPRYLADGARDVALRLLPSGADEAPGIAVGFATAADRVGGLVSPAFTADVLSRAHGLVAEGMLPALPGEPFAVPDAATLLAGATVLGIDLGDVIDGIPRPLAIDGVEAPLGLAPVMAGGMPAGVRMGWDIALRSNGALRVDPRTTCRMSVEQRPGSRLATCRVEHVSLVLPPGDGALVQLGFESLTVTQRDDRAPEFDVGRVSVGLGGDLGLLGALQDALAGILALGDAAPRVRSTPTGIAASYDLPLPAVGAGVFSLRDVAVHVGVDVPFDGRAAVATLGFSRRDDPFNVSVLAFGGGGYLWFEIAEGGIRSLEASLDFGGSISISLGIATAEVHALGGVRFALQGDSVRVTGFLRIGGSVDVLGLVSVSVELRVELTYEAPKLVGRASAVIEVDVTLWSGSLHIDSGDVVLMGGGSAAPPDGPGALTTSSGPPPGLDDWQAYRDAFAPASDS